MEIPACRIVKESIPQRRERACQPMGFGFEQTGLRIEPVHRQVTGWQSIYLRDAAEAKEAGIALDCLLSAGGCEIDQYIWPVASDGKGEPGEPQRIARAHGIIHEAMHQDRRIGGR